MYKNDHELYPIYGRDTNDYEFTRSINYIKIYEY